MAALCTQIPGGALAAAPAPGVRIPVTALPSGPTTQSALPTTIGGRTIYSPQVVSGAFGSTPYSVVTNPDGTVTGTIKQADNAGILQWRTFDIGANATVNVEQPSTTAVLLNKVSDGDWNHSTLIEGKLNANGQVYIYNPNGIIFGKTSQVNVNTLVATSLKISDSRFLAGLLANGTAAFAADPNASYVDAYGNVVPVGLPGAVMVEGDGANLASLTAANGGKILLVAPTIVNDGQLSAPDGQVLLAAGRAVYLAAPESVRMRGLQAGVNNNAIGTTVAAGDSVVTNEGKITVGTGNATLIARTVNQLGLVSATTSVSSNGSIYLIARDGARPPDQGATFTGNDFGGALVLGAGSVTEIQPTLDDSGTSGAAFNASQITLSAKSVHLEGDGAGHGARIQAPAGEVIINAIANTGSGSTASKGSGNSITLDAGAVIDVAGTRGTRLAMESNVIQVELRGTELADDPLLRNSPLRGKTVSVDVRKGNLKIANIQGWLDLVQHNVGQSTAVGGTVTLKAEDAVVLNQGSTVNVSGGMVSYLPGYVATSQLIWNGRLFDIASATADRVYSGVIDATPGPRNYEAGYIQGYSAGTISVDAPTASVGGTLVGTATPGPKQRDVSSRALDGPLGGQLLVGSYDKDAGYGLFQDHFVLGSGGSGLALDPAALAASGFTRLGVYSNAGDITVNSAVQLAAGGSLTLRSAGNVDLAAGISVPGGTVSVVADKSIIAEPNLAMDVSGLWTNDRVLSASERDAQGNPTNAVITKGGSITLSAPTVALGSGSRFDASGGAWLNASGKLSAGVGGSIGVISSTTANAGALTLGEGVAFSAYGISKGGTLTLSARNVTIGAEDPDPLGMRLDRDFFQQGGFAKYDIRGAGHLTVAAGTTVAPRMDNWISTRNTATIASGSMKDAFGITTLPLAGAMGSRGATDLSLSALAIGFEDQGHLNLEAGARILADPGATVSLNAGRQLTVDGEISAHGGTINLALTPTLDDIAGNSATQYFADRSIWIGSRAVLNASGTAARLWQAGTGLTQGTLLDGGSINIGHFEKDSATTLYAAPGYVVVEKGARLDVSGTTATMTLALGSRGGRSTRTVASAGGSIDIRAREGLLLEGSLSAAGGNASAAGGSLSVVLDREWVPSTTQDPASYPTAGRNLLVTATSNAFPTVAAPDTALTGWEGQGFVTAATINQGGFDWIRLKSQNIVSFDLGTGDLSLQARAGLTVDAPFIAAAPGAKAKSVVTLAAPYVQLGNADWRYQPAVPSAATPSVAGDVGLSINADTVDIIGQSALQGFDAATIAPSGDVRLVGQVPIDLSKSPAADPPAIEAKGSFSVAGSMTFTSAQLYPTSMSQFELTATGAGSHITFTRNANSPSASTPLSAAASLKVSAEIIDQNGIVRAPLGQIVLDAADKLSYGADSLTSVKADGLIPLGFVQNGRDWLYDFGNGNTVNLSDTTATNHYALPDKSIVSGGKSVTFNNGAVLDLSGGGDLYAYEFTPGPGGSKDVLAKTTGSSAANVFAILPGYASTVAPRDFQYAQDRGLKPGDNIYLSGIPGLAAGYYTLLPAHYALLPGAYSVTAASGTTDMAASGNVARLDGSWTVAGYRASLGGGSDNRWSGFTVTASSVVRTYSGFGDYSVNSFQAVLPSLPKDGGHVVFNVTRFLALDGLVRLGGASGGSNGIADISAPDIAVVANASDSVPAATLKLVAGDLVAMGADSLLIGGVRETTSAGDRVTVGAEKVVVQNDAAHPLTGPEVILAATDTVELKSRSVVQAKGPLSRTPRTLLLSNKSAPNAGADGALVRVSNGAAVALQRSYTDADGTIWAPAGTTGKLDIAANVTLSAGGSMMVDATRSTTIGSALTLADGTALGLGSSRISLGSGAPATVDGLRFDDAAVAALSDLSSLALTSYSTIDVYGTVNLGTAAMQSLSFTGGAMRGMAGANAPQATFTAQTIRFDQAGTDTASAATSGSVAFNAKDIEIGKGAFALHGFASATLAATNEIRAVGKGGALTADNDLTLAAGRITARSGTDATVTAGGKLKLTQGGGVVGTLPTLELGGTLAFKGKTITSDATIAALAGQVSLTGTNGVDVTGGTISAAGGSVTFGSTVAHAAAGSIALDGGNGNVTVDSTATLDVSATGADAGTLSVAATSGTATLDGTLKGGSDDATMTQGQFALDVGTVGTSAQFTTLNDKLNAGGFTESRTVRARHGDIVVADAGSGVDAIKAHQVILAADNGNITVGGQINASGPKGGRIELYAAEATATGKSGNVTLLGTARLLANATTAATSSAGSTGDGGSIVIGTATADGQPAGLPAYTTGDPAATGNAGVFIADGAVLDVRGSGAGQGGSVLLRAPRLSGNKDVAIATTSNTTLANAVRGASDLAIEGYKTYSAVTRVDPMDGESKPMITADDVGSSGSYYDDANKFLSAANKTTMQNRLGTAANLRAGVEVDSAGDLTVEVNEAAGNPQDRGWNLNTWRFGGQPGVLTLRAAGNLIVAGSISDGFTKPTSGKVGMPDWALDTSGNSSWSYRLVSGADHAAANPLATKSGAGDVKITFARTTGSATDLPVALVRTGTGSIDIAAGRDVILDTLSAGDQLLGASVYTAGKATSLSSTIANYNNTDYGSPKKTSTGAAFTSNGGSISILARGNVVGPVTNQMINNWLFRQGRSYVDSSGNTVFDTKSGVPQGTAWWSRFDYFNQGIATFGGGDITVIAETGNVSNVSASIATNAYWSAENKLTEQGGGDLVVRAGGDIRGGSFYVQKGSAVLTAGASVTAGDHVVQDSNANTIFLAPVLAAGDAQFRVAARGNLAIEGIFNPTMTAQSVNNVTATAASQLDASSTATKTLANQFGSYLTYADDSAVSLTSLSGDLVLKGNTGAVSAAAGGNLLVADTSWYGLLPGTLHARALGGNLTVENGFSLAPLASGQFELLAKGSILFHNNTPVVMLDVNPALLPTSANPIYGPTVFGDSASLRIAMQGNTVGTAYHTDGGLHAGDPDPVRIIALDGDIASTNLDTVLVLPKRAEISAGRDILDSTVASSALNPVAHIVSGPARVDFVAGRNFDLGDSNGVVTKGNLDNPYLPATGAGITVTAGATADYAGFAASYAASLDKLSSAAQTLLVADMKLFDPSTNDVSTAWTAFNALPTAARKSVLNDLFYEKIAEVTGAKGGGTLDLAAFDGVIASLFPTANITGGDINVFGSQLKTDRGGAITLFAPGGSVYAGLTSVPAYLSDNRRASDLGIFTVGGGAIESLVKNNFLVNLGRVFTLGGGDITLVSQYGDIDAGKGAKTSQATPPPIVTTDAKGNTEVDISGSIAGSGIATLRTRADVPASDVYPIAPRGIFDAGDAGLRSTGSVNIVAQTVLNANNIAAAGSVSGAKTIDTGGLGGGVSAPTAPPPTKTEGFAAPGAGDPNATSLTVELLGYGGADGLEPVTKAGQTSGFADDSEDECKKKKSQKPAANCK